MFAAAHPELLDRSILQRWYPPERLAGEAAHRVFLLPEGAASGDLTAGAQLQR